MEVAGNNLARCTALGQLFGCSKNNGSPLFLSLQKVLHCDLVKQFRFDGPARSAFDNLDRDSHSTINSAFSFF